MCLELNKGWTKQCMREDQEWLPVKKALLYSREERAFITPYMYAPVDIGDPLLVAEGELTLSSSTTVQHPFGGREVDGYLLTGGVIHSYLPWSRELNLLPVGVFLTRTLTPINACRVNVDALVHRSWLVGIGFHEDVASTALKWAVNLVDLEKELYCAT